MATPVPARLAENEFLPRTGSDLQGYWKGIIDTEPDTLPVELRIAEQPNGTFRGEGGIPMLGINGRPVAVTYDRPTVKLEVPTGSGIFEGEINRDNTAISGAWIQGGQVTRATLERVDYRAEHSQDAFKVYSFDSNSDLQGHWEGAWIVTIAKTKATIRFALEIAKLPGGSYSATLANIDEFGRDSPMPASHFQFETPLLRMQWKWAGGAYEGKLENGKLVGAWFQGGGSFPLVFNRAPSK